MAPTICAARISAKKRCHVFRGIASVRRACAGTSAGSNTTSSRGSSARLAAPTISARAGSRRAVRGATSHVSSHGHHEQHLVDVPGPGDARDAPGLAVFRDMQRQAMRGRRARLYLPARCLMPQPMREQSLRDRNGRVCSGNHARDESCFVEPSPRPPWASGTVASRRPLHRELPKVAAPGAGICRDDGPRCALIGEQAAQRLGDGGQRLVHLCSPPSLSAGPCGA